MKQIHTDIRYVFSKSRQVKTPNGSMLKKKLRLWSNFKLKWLKPRSLDFLAFGLSIVRDGAMWNFLLSLSFDSTNHNTAWQSTLPICALIGWNICRRPKFLSYDSAPESLRHFGYSFHLDCHSYWWDLFLYRIFQIQIPYARHYNPRPVYFKATFWRPKTIIQEVIFLKFWPYVRLVFKRGL